MIKKHIEESKLKLEQRNIELQQRIYDIKWDIESVIKLLEDKNIEKALKILKRVMYDE